MLFRQTETYSLLSIPHAGLRCRDQQVDSQISSYREKMCSHKTQGPPSASLLSTLNPSSPRRRSSEQGGGTEERKKKKQRRLRGVK